MADASAAATSIDRPRAAKVLAYPFHAPPQLDDAAARALLGGKGKSLADMTSKLGLPVPPGFTVVTEACRLYLEFGWTSALSDELDARLAALEHEMDRRFGDPERPLLLSVRSGGAASMPGMMDTVLNVGLDDRTTAGLGRLCGDIAFAEDCRARLAQTYLKSVGKPPPGDPRSQLKGAIEAVFRSWHSDRARAYRKIEGIADDTGTAVNIQAMVFGNLDDRSGTGVVFSRDPSTGTPRLYGDVLFRAQGEDVVAGTHRTLDIDALSRRLPEVGKELKSYVTAIERHYRDLVEVEFTIEAGRLWVLQARAGKRSPAAALRIACDMADDPLFPLAKDEAVRRVGDLLDAARSQLRRGDAPPVLTRGLAASPGLANGILVTNCEDAVARTANGEVVILARPETSPADVEGIAAAAGLLTSRGGFASHAAVVARGWAKPAVVGVSDMEVRADGIVIGERLVPVGSSLSLDGETGEVFDGTIDVVDVTPPEVARLRAWRDAGGSVSPGVAVGLGDDDLIILLAIKGMATKAAIADILQLEKPALDDRLTALGAFVEMPSPLFVKASTLAVKRANEVIAAHRSALANGAQGVLHAFKPYNDVFKALVTDWQTKQADGIRIANDHADHSYDSAILKAVSDCHTQIEAWLNSIVPAASLRLYASRLERAIDRVRCGDVAYLVSPRVDSYHNVWFELHEYLIRLAGRTRAEEEGAH